MACGDAKNNVMFTMNRPKINNVQGKIFVQNLKRITQILHSILRFLFCSVALFQFFFVYLQIETTLMILTSVIEEIKNSLEKMCKVSKHAHLNNSHIRQIFNEKFQIFFG